MLLSLQMSAAGLSGPVVNEFSDLASKSDQRSRLASSAVSSSPSTSFQMSGNDTSCGGGGSGAPQQSIGTRSPSNLGARPPSAGRPPSRAALCEASTSASTQALPDRVPAALNLPPMTVYPLRLVAALEQQHTMGSSGPGGGGSVMLTDSPHRGSFNVSMHNKVVPEQAAA